MCEKSSRRRVRTAVCTVLVFSASDVGDEIPVDRCLDPIVACYCDDHLQPRSSFEGYCASDGWFRGCVKQRPITHRLICLATRRKF